MRGHHIGRADPTVQEQTRPVSLTVLAKLGEWTEVHHLLHELLEATLPFRAGLLATAQSGQFDATRRRELFVNWRPCQERIYRLVEFSEGVQHVGIPFRREARHLEGARWAVEVVAFQLVIEESLSERQPQVDALVDLVDEFRTVCYRHLAIANRELSRLVRAHTQLSDALGRLPP